MTVRNGREERPSIPRLVPDFKWVACPHCGGRQPIPTWNEREDEPPIVALACDVRSCGRPYEIPA